MAIDIDEEIKKAREVAERIQKQADKQKGLNHGYYIFNSELANEYRQRAEWLEELKEYKELEKQGLLLKLPCNVGNTVYQLINSHIYEYKVIGICFDILQNKWMYEVAYEIGLEWFKTMCDFDVFGKSKTVFLTKEEAEQELKRLESAE